MNARRAAALGVGGGLVVTWLAAAAMRPAAPQVESSDAAPVVTETPIPNLDAGAQRLRERLQTAGALARSRRNPFQFVEEQKARTPARASAAAAPAVAASDVAPVASGPVVKLLGIAEDASPGGPVRTAVLSAAGQVFLVKRGEAVTSRYRVSAIAPDAVELLDQISQMPLILRLQ